jgi:(p)ppGpp synthase/HD superfamily hydrolase
MPFENSKKTDYFLKRRIALTHYLVGKKFYVALTAMAYVEKIATGLRKDGVTPEFQHMLEIALHIITLRDIEHEQETITAALLHDVREDYGVSHSEIERRFGSKIANAVEKLSKVIDGTKKPYELYFKELAECPIASIVKGCDRAHNFQSMINVFSDEKQNEYISEGVNWFLPMLKEAQRNFPEQFLAYQNVRHYLKSQMTLIAHNLKEKSKGNVNGK